MSLKDLIEYASVAFYMAVMIGVPIALYLREERRPFIGTRHHHDS